MNRVASRFQYDRPFTSVLLKFPEIPEKTEPALGDSGKFAQADPLVPSAGQGLGWTEGDGFPPRRNPTVVVESKGVVPGTSAPKVEKLVHPSSVGQPEELEYREISSGKEKAANSTHIECLAGNDECRSTNDERMTKSE